MSRVTGIPMTGLEKMAATRGVSPHVKEVP